MQTFKDKLLNETKAEVLLQTQSRLRFGAVVQMEPSPPGSLGYLHIPQGHFEPL